MSISTVRTRSRWAATGLVLTLIACGAAGMARPTATTPRGGRQLQRQFTATEATAGCQGFVTPDSTTGVLRVTQSGRP